MTRRTAAALACFFGALVRPLSGQAPTLSQLSAQQHSPALSWRQIVTPHYTVIFPEALADDARRAATLLERSYEPLTQTLGSKPERIPVLLAGESLVPNAFVSWFPRRTIWHPLPKTSAAFAGPIDWYTLLAAHEGRHVAQERHMRSGIIGFASRLFGDEATALLAGRLYFPDWLWEGDAVGMETALTPGGRGRQPSFLNRVRAMRLTGKAYPYYAAWLGSYRTYYPGAYELGYLLTGHARRTYGADVWGRVIRRATRNPLTPYALSMALKRETGKSLGALHEAAVAEADSLWQRQLAATPETPAALRTRPRAGFHIWHWPQYARDASVIAAYTDLDHVTSLRRIDSAGREEVLLRRFAGRGEFPFHVAAERVIWLEYDVHPRWGEVDYLTLKELDLATRRTRTVRARTRVYAVALSADGARIAALEMTPSRRSRLVLLDARSGATQRTYPNEEKHFLTNPAWSDDSRHVSFIAVHRSRGNALVRLDLQTATADTLIPWTFEALSRPVEHDGKIYFGSPVTGLDQIHAVDIAAKRRFQVTSRPFGAYDADVTMRREGGVLLFRDYGGEGDDIAEAPLDPSTWLPLARDNEAGERAFADALTQQENASLMVDSSDAWRIEPYRGYGRVFDVHSAAIIPGDDVDPWSVQLFSRNVLNTLGATVAYRFNPVRETHGVDAGLSYAGLFPIFDLGLRAGSDASTYDDSTGTVPYTWRERSATLTTRLPLTFLHGLSVSQVLASASLGYTRIDDQPVQFVFDNNNGVLQTASYTLLAAHAQPSAYRDLVGSSLYAYGRYRHTPFGGDYQGHAYLLQAGASVRGPIAHHGLSFVAALEEQRPTNYAFSSIVPFARGYEARARYRLWRAGASYALPLWYPDLSAGPLLFVRRVQAEAFGDYSVGYSAGGTNKTFYRSVGVELTADVVPLATNQTWRAGVRYSYRADAAEPWRAQFIVRLP